jgi:ribonuclease BN (tRNA processing enzyme)
VQATASQPGAARAEQNGLRLTVLGASTPYPRPDAPCSGYLVESGETTLWMDAGAGTLAELQRHTSLASLSGIWISHTHADHSADLLVAYYALRFADATPPAPIPLVGPEHLLDRLEHYLGGAARAELPRAFDFVPMAGYGDATLGDLELSWSPVDHGVPAFGLRVEAHGGAKGTPSLAYSGDSAPCESLVELAEGATAFLCEAGAATEQVGAPHTTPAQAGAMASRAGAARLILTHIGDGLDDAAAIAAATGSFGGVIDVATPGRRFELL